MSFVVLDTYVASASFLVRLPDRLRINSDDMESLVM